MNAKWFKQNRMLVGFVAAFIILFGGVIWQGYRALEKQKKADNFLKDQVSEIDRLGAATPSPSHENIAIVKQDREQLDRLYNDLLAASSRSQPPTQEILRRPVGFLQLMAAQFAHLRQGAETAGVKLPEGFAFGFSRYAGTSPTLPARNLSEEDTRKVLVQLVKQLWAIEKVTELLIASQVSELAQIRRAEVEPGSTGQDALDIQTSNDLKGLYETVPLEFQFMCTTDALRTFLNKLSQSDWFFVVRRLEITGEVSGAATTGGTRGRTSVEEQTVAQRSTRLRVTIHIDQIEFPQKTAVNPSPEK